MKKYINLAFIYAILALVSGVFYREFTKIQGYTERTTLSVTHTHLFMLGTIMFLIIGIFSLITNLEEQKQFKLFMKLYNIGLPLMVIMFFVRGILQVMNAPLSKGASSAISGIAGVSHILVGISIILLFIALRNSKKIKE